MGDTHVPRVLFVCLGNICRSPTAEAVLRKMADGQELIVDSAGTGDWHVGKPPDSRAIDAGRARGYDLSPLRARQATAQDFNDFDLILAMDRSNLARLEKLRPGDSLARLELFLSYAETELTEVPDPYFGDFSFDAVIDLVEAGCEGILKSLRSQ